MTRIQKHYYKLVCKPEGQPFRSICGIKSAEYSWDPSEKYAPYLVYKLGCMTTAPPATVGCFCLQTIEAADNFAQIVQTWPIHKYPLFILEVVGYKEQKQPAWYSTCLYFQGGTTKQDPNKLPKAYLTPKLTDSTSCHIPVDGTIIFRRVKVVNVVKEVKGYN